MSVNETLTTDIFTLNRQVYQRLKFALSIGLRRQIFFAVCDDLHLRNQVATRLHSTLAYPVSQVLYHPAETGGISTPAYPRLVTLRLNLNDPNPIAQINQWLANYPPPVVGESKDSPGRPLPIPAFQIVGVELLTKQSVAVQRLFLHYLRLSEQYFSTQEASPFLESSLLFWVPRPWLYAIQQSAPKFWQCRTGVFIFAGEPTPTLENRSYPENFSSLRSVDLGNLEKSILDESITSEEITDNAVQDFKFTEEDEDFLGHPSENMEDKLQPSSTKSAQNDVIPKLSSFLHISNELMSLFEATLNPNIDEDANENLQAKQLLWEIEQLKIQQVSGEELAVAYHNLGTFYRFRIEQGQSSLENLMVAIIAYQEAVSYDDTSPQLPDTLNDLGTLYWMLHRTPGSSDDGQTYIQQGIEFYQLAIKLISPDSQSEIYARVQNNLATAYGDLARFSHPVENWQEAVKAYNEALRYRTEEIDPLKYAACQNNLGTAYWHLGQYSQPVEHLQKAIAAYNLALVYYKPKDEPIKYGMIQNNIGTAYWNLSQYEKPLENLQLAVDLYREALKYRTPANIPAACAATRNNLGTAYWHIANLPQVTKDIRQNFLQLCIKTYQETLTLANSLNQNILSFDLLATQNNLGLAHYQLVTDPSFKGDKQILSQHLEASLENHVQALGGLVKNTEAYHATFSHIVKIIRTFHLELGIQGQNLALSKVPGNLIPEILPKL
ncbi:tetratricopeptide repeat protein [Anabaena sphaerica FACHB-251]|uniref:Tetratricopeptide repeat protein n=1 Tax=Anabaena sphaerica FACHB-251 TaxID=2692883 RepID=A0A927A2Y1_9NOST|nr:tetratricopeptide repeat protein [Anabaena sphaerica]MBD2295731.1 tetratricopeptide repeat protein [Anabaena sphaerica FACHB-251]